MDQPDERVFTLQEAEKLLPHLIDRLGRLRSLRLSMEKRAPEIARLAERGRENAGNAAGSAYLHELLQFEAELRGFSETGCILRDLDRGLLDFPAIVDGRKVFLCWIWGERSIEWWHEINSGFSGRQPLDREKL